ncbi:hypothetical protein FA13DRAFT_1794999 [Coprinellus micaceus]|uniref:Uncharacterized protein n=1 Tax=Coprinellus micaceus TaxID=71717 RepID=A0A4Y7SEM3_COPMI|nr:hypothetical protein FA13DRAFT_1801514 [Coprinellus micaceus]TEB27189.1 hypothetical protein FA13DRAFT_1794999 [Coprinellus micaceus]
MGGLRRRAFAATLWTFRTPPSEALIASGRRTNFQLGPSPRPRGRILSRERRRSSSECRGAEWKNLLPLVPCYGTLELQVHPLAPSIVPFALPSTPSKSPSAGTAKNFIVFSYPSSSKGPPEVSGPASVSRPSSPAFDS